MPGLIAMISVFVVVTIEMFFATRGAGHSHSSEWDTIPEDMEGAISLKARVLPFSNLESGRIENEEPRPANGHVISNYTAGSAEDVGSRYPKSPERQLDDEEDLDLDDLDPIADESAYLNPDTSSHRHRHDHGQHVHADGKRELGPNLGFSLHHEYGLCHELSEIAHERHGTIFLQLFRRYDLLYAQQLGYS